MKKNHFVALLFITGVLCVFLLIYKQTWLTGLSYQQQELEKNIQKLVHERDELQRTLYQLQDPNRIHEFATTQLGMKKLSLSHSKTIALTHDCQQ